MIRSNDEDPTHRMERDEWGTQRVAGIEEGGFARKRVMEALGLAFGATMICLLVEISPLVSWWHMAVYHFDGPAGDLFLPVLVNIAVLWVLLAGLIVLSGRGGRLRATIWAGLMLGLPWVGLKEGTMAASYVVPHRLSVAVMGLGLAGMVGLQVFWRPVREGGPGEWVERLVPAFRAVLYALSLSGVVMLGQLLYFFVRAKGLNDARPLHAASATANVQGPKRVVVILFDELSFEQTYGNRSENVQLPAFDALAAEGTVLRDVRPSAEYTDRALPSLLTGRTVEQIRSSADGQTLSLETPQGWSTLDPQDTVFADALKAGYGTGLAGWYNPYCRIIPQVLDRCEWRAHAILPNLTANDSAVGGPNLLANSIEPLRGFARAVPGFLAPNHQTWGSNEELTERHVKDYRQLSAAADSLLGDAQMTFVFLHMPMPHPGGIYDRKSGQMARRSTSYLDNLALADLELGHVREVLTARGEWEATMVMVLGDHSWRTGMWEESLFWTEEDKKARGGRVFDDRPAMVVKLAGRSGPSHIDTAFEAKRTRWMLDEVMGGRIRTEGELARWVEAQAR